MVVIGDGEFASQVKKLPHATNGNVVARLAHTLQQSMPRVSAIRLPTTSGLFILFNNAL
jgi:hypothetical protein